MTKSLEEVLARVSRLPAREQDALAAWLVEKLEPAVQPADDPPAGGEPVFDPTARPIEEVFAEIAASVPDEEWAKLPRDGSWNLDHYLYGSPKRE